VSGIPNPTDVRQLLALLDERADLLKDVEELKPRIAELRTKETRISNINSEVQKVLQSMDVADSQRGNFGHENRVALLVTLLRDAIVASPLVPRE
jgi:hypothetical protein